MRANCLKFFMSLILFELVIGLNCCVITSAVDHAVTMPVKVATSPL
jgi:hypothetical protein